MKPRILGYVMARDEWPLLGLAIAHVLESVVDHVVVVDHGSTDGSTAGLDRLRQEWNGRITVIGLQGTSFMQEATTAVILAAVGASAYDWIYVFDADEFLLAEPEGFLSVLLSDLPENVRAVRYEIHQWLAPHDMCDQQLHDYGLIVKRALPCIPATFSAELIADDISRGFANYFDVPFPSKVIVRARYASMLTAGAHAVKDFLPVHELTLDSNSLRVAHVPLLSRDRLLLKSRQGHVLRAARFPFGHGWQSQMLHQLDLDGRLDRFWATHSDHEGCTMPSSGLPITVIDLSLQKVLEPAVCRLGQVLSSPVDLVSRDDRPYVDLDAVIAVVHSLLVARGAFAGQRDQAIAERDQVTERRESLAAAVSGWQRLVSSYFDLLLRMIVLISRRPRGG